MSKMRMIGYYDSVSEAISVVEELKRQGYSSDEISIISKDMDNVDHIVNENELNVADDVAAGAVAGAATVGILGGLGGVLVGLGALAIPGIGPIIAAGPIVAGITGAIAGVGAGGFAGALIGVGLPEDEAYLYSEHFNNGKILVLVDNKSI